ncbi:TonB-dependent receptor [Croceicoccus mobilis]|uniref:TonB-dependent receptor n=1 Tax=Croceicoccus mobilis TaxID=1703339 RepID=UPI0015601509|nr:TonB-dependent receptor [Croceicoccus mobilis]
MAGQFIKQASLIGCCAAAIAVSSSAANAQTRVFDLPPANAVETIPAFAQQSGLQILAPADRIVGVRTPAIKGAYDARAALRKLIANTGLVISSDTGSTIILKWQEPKRVSATTAAPLSAAKSVTSTAAVQPVAEAAALEPPLEDIVVLGSRIRGAAPVGSTVLDLDRADIEELPAVTTGDIIQTMPSVINLGNSESSRAAGGGGNFTFAQGINIHGVGNGATLMLIDGRRVVPQGTIGSINDSSLIPANALERVEIVPDGASALYGSDAMAGVANLVIRRDYDGLELTGRQGFADDYSETQLGASFGADWSSGKFGLVYNYSYHTDLNASDRGYATADLSGRGGDDYRGSQCSPPTLVAGGVTYALPSGGLNEANAGDLVAGSINSCDIYANADLIPEVERHNVVATFDQDITDTLSVAATGFYAKRSVYMTAGLTTATFTVPDTNAYYVSSISGPQTIQYAFADMATNDTDASNEFYQGTVEADWVLPFDWRINGAFTYGYSEDARAITRGLYNSAFTAALASSDPATAFNPYGGANDPALLDSLAQSVGGYFTGDSKQWVVDLGADGPLFDLPGGTVRLAAGYQHLNVRSRIFVRIGTNDSYFISTAADHTRKVDSGYAELLVPIFGPGNAIPGFQRLDLNIAGRFDSYNDSGSTTNPKIGVTWEPVSGLSLHGSYGKSFRAPNIASASRQAACRWGSSSIR